MGEFKFTEKELQGAIDAAKKTGKPFKGLSAGGGLTYTVSSKGTASWVLRYRLGGKPRELTLGNYPDMKLKAARRLAQAARVKIDQGVDVAAEKQQTIAAAKQQERRLTFGALTEEWLQRYVDGRVKHPDVVRRAIKRNVLPVIGTRPADEVTPTDVDKVLRKILDRDAPTMANDVLRYLKAIGSYGVKRRLLPFNPAADFAPTDAGGHEKGRTRALSRDELATLFAAMQKTPNLGRENYLTFLILLATCVRKGELVAAKWDEFDLERGIWNLPAERTKTGAAISIPLVATVVGWLKELQVFAAGSPYVLPARVQRGAKRQRFPHISPDTLNVALKRVRHDVDHFTIHDMRRTARTQLAALGVSREVAERALNHALRDVEGIYNRHDYFEERKHALAQWADLLASLESGKARAVVSLSERRKA